MIHRYAFLMCFLFTVLGTSLVCSSTNPDIDSVVASVVADAERQEALEAESIHLLQSSDVSWGERYTAAHILARIGSQKSVAPIAPLLTDPESSHLALFALEPLPFPEVDEAFRAALKSTTGTTRAGIISSIAKRKDTDAVDALTQLLHDTDHETMIASIRALGQIGAVDTFTVLRPLLDEEEPVRCVTAEACLALLPHLMHSDADTARATLLHLQTASFPVHIRTGAFTVLLNAEPHMAPVRIIEAIRGQDPVFQAYAIASIISLPGDDVPRQFLDEMPSLPDTMQASLLSVLAERDDTIPLDMLHRLLQSDVEAVRLTTIRLIGNQGTVSSVTPLTGALARAPSRAEIQALIESLSRLDEIGVDAHLIAEMQQADEDSRVHIIEALVCRQSVDAWQAIYDQIAHEPVQLAAIHALGELAAEAHLPVLLDLLGSLDEAAARTEAERAIATLCRRLARKQGAVQIMSAQYGAAPEGPWVDVTDIVTAYIKEGELSIQASNNLFGDPAPNIVKTLQVDYIADGIPGQAEVLEGQTLNIVSEAIPPDVIAHIAEHLDNTQTAEETASLLRVLSLLGGAAAYDLVLSRVGDDDIDIHDAAVRALTDWSGIHALEALMDIASTTENATHRVLTSRACVRLLRQGMFPVSHTLTFYDRLIASAQTIDEYRTIIAGLADVSHPAAFEPLRIMRNNEAVQAEADMALSRIMSQLSIVSETQPVFDGSTLENWYGDPALWRVEEGHIIGETKESHPIGQNCFLTWQGSEPADFELKLRYRIDSPWANSGIQVRSERFDGYRVRGYQPDIATEDWITGICYEEGGRGILARRGQHVEFRADGTQCVTVFAEEDDLGRYIRVDDWNEYHIVAWDNTIITRINGHIMHMVTDSSPIARLSGVIAFQLHTGPPMRIRFSDITLHNLLPDNSR